MLRELATVEAMTDKLDIYAVAFEGMTMFSNFTEADLEPIPVGQTFEEQDADFNRVPVAVYRATSKVIATFKDVTLGSYPVDWSSVPSLNSPLELTYTPSHWRVMQYATKTWVAPNYEVANYNAATGPGLSVRPSTYYNWTFEGDYPYATGESNISQYAANTAAGTELEIVADPVAGAGYNDALSVFDARGAVSPYSTPTAKYIGENVRVGTSSLGALNHNTTYAFISTGVKATHEAVWGDGDIAWEEEEYGWSSDTSGDNSDIYLVQLGDRTFITSTSANATGIASGTAVDMGYYYVADVTGLNPADTSNKHKDESGFGTAYDSAKSGTPIMVEDFYELIDFHVFKYEEGYVHFKVDINKLNNNQYEVLRNQFIHMNVTGMGEIEGTFPGYPGKAGDPRTPIDPNDDTENNPYPLIPDQPVDPAQTYMMVNVTIHPWTYISNGTVLQ
jgi:hypothetical protein